MAVRRIADGKLTAIANAIRAKTGSTGTLTVDAMPAAIAGIVTGAALPEGIAVGTFEGTPGGTYNPVGGFTIEHGLGKKPAAVFIWRPGETVTGFINGGAFYAHTNACTLYTDHTYMELEVTPELTETTFLVPTNSAGRVWFGTYIWVAVG